MELSQEKIYFQKLKRVRGDTKEYYISGENIDMEKHLVQGKQYFVNAKDIWLRDFMPVKTHDGRYVSFRYEPSYLNGYESLRTDYRRDLAKDAGIDVEYSDINLDGGNIVFSPLRKKAIISDRVFFENPERERESLLAELSRILAAQIIIIPALGSDMTGHADGMVRFIDENTVIGNRTPYKAGHEQKIKKALKKHGISVIDFPYFESKGISAVGTYLNFLETDGTIFLPTFGVETDDEAIDDAKKIFKKKIIPVRCEKIAEKGGCLNCISWEK